MHTYSIKMENSDQLSHLVSALLEDGFEPIMVQIQNSISPKLTTQQEVDSYLVSLEGNYKEAPFAITVVTDYKCITRGNITQILRNGGIGFFPGYLEDYMYDGRRINIKVTPDGRIWDAISEEFRIGL